MNRSQHYTTTMKSVSVANEETKLSNLNSEAIRLLCEGYCEEARRLLGSCLRGINLQLGCAVSYNEDHHEPPALFTIDMEGVLDVCDTQRYAAPLNCFTLFKFAFAVDDDASCQTWNESMLMSLLALMSYNLAMMHHDQGFVHANLSDLAKARRLYEFALLVLSKANSVGKPTMDTALLEAALYNDLGHVHSFLGDVPGVIFCRESLKNLMRNVLLDPEDNRFFQANLNESSKIGITVAPAA